MNRSEIRTHCGKTEDGYSYRCIEGEDDLCLLCGECGLPVMCLNGVHMAHFDVEFDVKEWAEEFIRDHGMVWHEPEDDAGHPILTHNK